MLSKSQHCLHCWTLYTRSPGSYLTAILQKTPFLLSRAVHVTAITSNQDPCSPCPPKPRNPSGGCGSDSGGSKGRVSYKKYIALPKEDHDAKNMRIGRPMSPHLTVFGPTIPAMTSIVQRISGTILTFYAVLLSGGTLFLSNGIETFVSMIQSLDLSGFSIFIVKLFIGASFTFHYFNGIRFVGWNAAKFYTMKETYVSAKYVIIAASVLNILFALL